MEGSRAKFAERRVSEAQYGQWRKLSGTVRIAVNRTQRLVTMNSTDDLPTAMTPVINTVGNALVASIPAHWTRASLNVAVEARTGAVVSMPHSISSPDFPSELVAANEELMLATRELQLLCERAGTSWKDMRMEVWQEGEAWRFRSDFNYSS